MAGRSNPSRRVVYWNLFDFLRAMLCNRGLNKWTGVPRTKIRNLAGFMFCRIHRRSLRLISRSSIRLSPFLTGPSWLLSTPVERFDQDHVFTTDLKKNLSALILFFACPPRSLSFPERDLDPMRSDLRLPCWPIAVGWWSSSSIELRGVLTTGRKGYPFGHLHSCKGAKIGSRGKSLWCGKLHWRSLVFVVDSEANTGRGSLTLGGFPVEK